MPEPIPESEPRGLRRVFSARRLRTALLIGLVFSLLLRLIWAQAPYFIVLSRMWIVGLVALSAFGLFERWPARLPGWIARWALQVVAVALAAPFAAFLAYSLTTIGLDHPWWRDGDRLSGFGSLTMLGVLIMPWIAVAALLRQIRGEAERQRLVFELERSEFERRALDARMRLLQAQIEPHFLFNTLANVHELVDGGSEQASPVLSSLIAYLRAAIPRLQDSIATLRQELDLVRAYLEVMQMRIPDRLQFTLYAEEAALELYCPPMTLLTLVENAVRHGIDPAEDGGRIDVRVTLRSGRCRAEVIDTGTAFPASGVGLGTGLANLRERLQLAFGGDAQLRLSSLSPHGVCAEVEFPMRSPQ